MTDPSVYGAAAAALAAVLALIWLAQRAARLRGLPLRLTAGGRGSLSVVERLPLDARRRLVLVACGGRQVLLLTGGPSDLVVGWAPPAPPEGAA